MCYLVDALKIGCVTGNEGQKVLKEKATSDDRSRGIQSYSESRVDHLPRLDQAQEPSNKNGSVKGYGREGVKESQNRYD
jgi:hypothetical protein